MFGFKLVRQSKLDNADLAAFKTITNRAYRLMTKYWLHEICDEFERKDINLDGLMKLRVKVGSYYIALVTILELYTNNKFSLPSSIMGISNALNKMDITMSHFDEMIHELNRLTLSNKFKNEYDDCDNNEDDEMKIYGMIQRTRTKVLYDIGKSTDSLVNIIIYDITRIDNGVDIIRDYYNHTKRVNLLLKTVMLNNYRQDEKHKEEKKNERK